MVQSKHERKYLLNKRAFIAILQYLIMAPRADCFIHPRYFMYENNIYVKIFFFEILLENASVEIDVLLKKYYFRNSRLLSYDQLSSMQGNSLLF